MQPFTLFDFTSGIDQSREEWLIPDKTFSVFDDGYIELGYIKGREGYNQYAVGNRGSAPECESRIVARITDESTGVNSTTSNPGVNFTLDKAPLRRGSITLTDGTETLTDDGLGAFTSDMGTPSGSVNYTTGAFTGVVFGTSSGAAITATYDYHPGNPVMMIANYVSDSNVRQLIVADTKYINRYNSSTNRLDDISRTYTITGGTLGTPTTVTVGAGHELIDGMQVQFYGVAGGTELNGVTATVTVLNTTQFTVPTTTAANPTAGYAKVVNSGTDKDFFHWVNYPDANDENLLVFTNNVDPVQYLKTSTVSPLESESTFVAPDGADAYSVVTAPTTTGSTFTNLKALRVHYQKDRLIFLRTKWNVSSSAKTYPKRITISGFGANALKFASSSPGAGQIDLPDQRWIISSEDNQDDLLIETELNPWSLKYTGNDVVPFTLQRIGVTSGFTGGSNAPMSTITHRNLTYTVNKSGIVATDGQNVERADAQIPNYVLNEIDPEGMDYIFSGVQKDDEFLMMLYPSDENTTGSDDVLVLNYDFNAWSRFRTAFSCIGNFNESFDITWDDLSIYATWDEFADAYGSWDQIAYNKGSIVTILGGHNGQIWRGFQTSSLDAEVRIRGITAADPAVVTTDYNNYVKGDVIYFSGISGMTEMNGQSGTVISRTDNSVTVSINSTDFTAYTSGGTAARQIPFNVRTKKFNPFIEQGKQVRVGWCEIFCDVVGAPGDDDNLKIRFYKGDYGEQVDSGYKNSLPLELIISNRAAPSPTLNESTQTKIWKKFRINQTGNFFSLAIANESPLRNFKIHSIRLGMAPAGPLRDQ